MQTNIKLVMMPRISFDMTLQEGFSFFKSWNFVLFLAPMLMILIGATPTTFAMPLDGLARTVYWVFCVVGYMIGASVILILMGMLTKKYKIGYFLTPITCLPNAYGATKFAEYFSTILSNEILSYSFVYMPYFFLQYMMILGIELIVFIWVLPAYLNRIRNKPTPEGVTENKDLSQEVISANGKKFLLYDIMYIRANEHYVTIHTVDQEVLVRSTFKAILTQVPQGYGFQVHRSCWVACKGVDLGRSLLQNTYVVLSGGEKITIARSRQNDARKWLDNMCQSH
jgi:hypothetical protein